MNHNLYSTNAGQPTSSQLLGRRCNHLHWDFAKLEDEKPFFINLISVTTLFHHYHSFLQSLQPSHNASQLRGLRRDRESADHHRKWHGAWHTVSTPNRTKVGNQGSPRYVSSTESLTSTFISITPVFDFIPCYQHFVPLSSVVEVTYN